jgi:hypothetical protein
MATSSSSMVPANRPAITRAACHPRRAAQRSRRMKATTRRRRVSPAKAITPSRRTGAKATPREATCTEPGWETAWGGGGGRGAGCVDDLEEDGAVGEAGESERAVSQGLGRGDGGAVELGAQVGEAVGEGMAVRAAVEGEFQVGGVGA